MNLGPGFATPLLYCVSFVAGVGCGSVGAGVEKWSDLTGQVEVGVSSRPAMVASLTDGSTGRPARPHVIFRIYHFIVP
jgi:hypothetical protein